MNFTIFSIGDSGFLEQVLISLALINGTGDFERMVAIGLLIGVIGAVTTGITSGGQKVEIQHVFLGMIIYLCMFVPTTRVNIQDGYTGQVRIVANVPIGAAVSGGVISLVGYKITELFEVGYGPIIPKVTETEFAESLKILSDLRNKASQSSVWQGLNTDAGGGSVDMKRSWENYIKDCVFFKIQSNQSTADDLITQDINTSLAVSNDLIITEIFVTPGGGGTTVTCTNAWTELNTRTTLNGAATVSAMNSMLSIDPNKHPTGVNSITKTRDSISALLGSGIDSQQYMKTAVLEPVFNAAAAGKYNEYGDVTNALMVNQAIQQRNLSWATEQTMFMSIVRPMLAFFEAFIYAITPIMAFVIVMGQRGIQLAGKYFSMIVWVQLWFPLLAIVNLFIYNSATNNMATYAAMSGHSWTSFYAMNSAADVMQTWVATGGMLASATPALALMLIYGSAVTATHLAGRLQSGDVIDEKQNAPDLKNSAPLMSSTSLSEGSALGGVTATGGEALAGNISAATQVGKSVTSTNTNTQSVGNNFSEQLSNSTINSQTGQLNNRLAETVGNTVSSSDGKIANAINSHGKDFTKKFEVGNEKSNEAIGAIAGSVDGSMMVDGNQLAESLFGMTPMGKAGQGLKAAGEKGAEFRAGFNSMLSNMGIKQQPGTEVALYNGGNDSNASDAVSLQGKASISGSATQRDTDKTKQSTSDGTSSNKQVSYSDSDVAQFQNQISGGIVKSGDQSFSEAGGNSQMQALMSSAQEVQSSSKAFEAAQNLSNNFGSQLNMPMNKLAGLINGRTGDGDQAGHGAREHLSQGIKTLPLDDNSKMMDAISNKSAYYKDTLGMSESEASTAGMFSALTNPQNYMDGSGDLNEQAMEAGMNLASSTLGLSTGENINTPQSTGAFENSNLDTPNASDTSISDKAKNLDSPDSSTFDQTKHLANQDLSKVPGSPSAAGAIESGFNTSVDGVQSADSSNLSQLNSGHEDKARDFITNDNDTSKAGALFGAMDNGSNYMERQYDKISGGLSAGAEAATSGAQQAIDHWKNLTPEQRDDLRAEIQSGKDLINNEHPVIGPMLNASGEAGQTMIGGAMAAYQLMSGGDFSEASKDLSLEEKGYILANGLSEGVSAANADMNNFNQDTHDTLTQYAQNHLGMTSSQSEVYASQFGMFNENRDQSVENLRGEYAMRDDHGNAMKDDNGRYMLSEKNEAFTQELVERIEDVSEMGNRSGSHAAAIAGYNMMTGRT